MSKIVRRALGVAVSADPGVAALVLYFGSSKLPDGSDRVLTNSGDTPDVGIDVGLPTPVTVGDEQLYVINLDQVPQVAALPEGEYDFGFAYKDQVGNESDITEAEDVTLDLTPPEKPAKVVVISAP